MIRLGILGSTKGTSVLPIIRATEKGLLNASIELVVSNNAEALILEKAKKGGIESCFISHKNKSREVFDKEISERLKEKEVDLVLLVGFMRILSRDFVLAWGGKIINVHPSLLPKYAGGMNEDVHGQVLKVDGGPILIQRKCPVLEHDTVESLKERVQKLEGEAFIEVIRGWKKDEK